MSSRRTVLKLLGGGVVVSAATVGGFVALNQPSRVARAPWQAAGGYDEFRRRALSYALLAPNPHNRQPWLVRLEGERALSLYCDLDRRLPVTDPFDRQIAIGCGAFLELLSMAAAQDGYGVAITPFPQGADMAMLDTRPVAHVVFEPGGASPDPLFGAILARRSNKSVYRAEDVPAPHLQLLAQAGAAYGQTSKTDAAPELVARLCDLTWRAHERETLTPDAMQESVDLMRIGAREVAANPDGIELEGPFLAAAHLVGVLNRQTLADPTSSVFRQGLAMYREMAMSARAFGWILNPNATRADQLDAGRAYARVNLQATALGLGVHPWSQALQEYEAMAPLYREAHDVLGVGQRLQMLYRIGYADPVMETPRRGLSAHLV